MNPNKLKKDWKIGDHLVTFTGETGIVDKIIKTDWENKIGIINDKRYFWIHDDRLVKKSTANNQTQLI